MSQPMGPFVVGTDQGESGEMTIPRYVGGKPGLPVEPIANLVCPVRVHRAEFPEVSGRVYVYCRFRPLAMNPADFVDDRPACRQTVTLGMAPHAERCEAVTFGIVDDDRASARGQANYVPGLFNGEIEYFGMYARPGSAYDFKIHIDLDRQRLTAWVAGAGDDEWFPLAVDAALAYPVRAIGSARIDQLDQATGIERLVVQGEPWPDGEALEDTSNEPACDLRYQPMRSLWRRADRHVTVARTPKHQVIRWSGYWPGWWLGFPDVVQTGPTSLIATHNDGPGHGGGGRIWLRHSDDLGQTWPRSTVLHYGGGNCPRLQKLRDGSLLVTADLYANPYHNIFFRSADAGRTWKQVGRLDPVAAGGHDCCVPSRVTEMSDGSWLVVGTWAPSKPFECTRGEVFEFYRSPDQGQTWQWYNSLEENPRGVSEASIVPLPDGRWWLVAREGYCLLPGVRCWSDDEGRTWSRFEELPFGIHGRTCAGLLSDGQIMTTFRACYGPIGLWAHVDTPDAQVPPLAVGVHFNDRRTVGLGPDGLHIASDGSRGQLTKYVLRCPNGSETRLDVTVEVKVLTNRGRAASLGVPYVGRLRIFSDHAEFAHDPALRVDLTPGQFHTLRILSENRQAVVFVDGQERIRFRPPVQKAAPLAWSPIIPSVYQLEFGNEAAEASQAAFDWVPEMERSSAAAQPANDEALPSGDLTSVTPATITPAATGHSIWRRIEAAYADERGEYYRVAWKAADGVFPDQYQLDHVIEVEASVSGCDQGYSGWTQLEDGRILVLNYTDDTARWNRDMTWPPLGVAWIRGTFIHPEDLPD